MHDERQRGTRSERRLRRPVDRIEDLVAWVLITLALLTAVVAAVTGARMYGEGMQRVGIETRERTQVQAVLLDSASYALTVDDKGRAVRPLPVAVPARYTAPDGIERQANVQVQGPLTAGARVPVWVDRSGGIVAAPESAVHVAATAAASAVGFLALGAVVLAGVWVAVHEAVLRRNASRWAREWEQVEPRWSGRTL